MFLFEDIIEDTIKEVYCYTKDNKDDANKYYLLKQTDKFAKFTAKKLRRNKKLPYSYSEKLIILKNITEQIFVTEYALFYYGISMRNHFVVIKELIENIINAFENNNIDFSSCNIYKYTQKYRDEIFNKFHNKFRHGKSVNKFLSVFYDKNFLRRLSEASEKYIIYVRFGSDILNVKAFSKTSGFSDKLIDMRKNKLLKSGYMIPKITSQCDTALKADEYQILIRGKKVFQDYFIYDDAKSIDEIFTHIDKVITQNIHNIFSVKDTYSYLEYVKKEYDSEIVKILLNRLDINDIKKVLCNLIQNDIRINDLPYIIENLAVFARYDKDADSLTKKMADVNMILR